MLTGSFLCHWSAKHAQPPSPTPPIPIISSVAYAIIDVQDASINYSSELFVGAGSSAENSESAPLAGLIASLDKEIQERIVDANKSFCVIVYDGSSFERTAFISSAEQSVELPAYFVGFSAGYLPLESPDPPISRILTSTLVWN